MSNTLRELSTAEVEMVAGAGLFGAIAGSLLVSATNGLNSLLDATAPLGQALNLIPGVAPIHALGDEIIYAGSKAADAVGQAIGGSSVKSIPLNFHYLNEWITKTV